MGIQNILHILSILHSLLLGLSILDTLNALSCLLLGLSILGTLSALSCLLLRLGVLNVLDLLLLDVWNVFNVLNILNALDILLLFQGSSLVRDLNLAICDLGYLVRLLLLLSGLDLSVLSCVLLSLLGSLLLLNVLSDVLSDLLRLSVESVLCVQVFLLLDILGVLSVQVFLLLDILGVYDALRHFLLGGSLARNLDLTIGDLGYLVRLLVLLCGTLDTLSRAFFLLLLLRKTLGNRNVGKGITTGRLNTNLYLLALGGPVAVVEVAEITRIALIEGLLRTKC